MNYEKVILELMGRIKDLEETVGTFDFRLSQLEGEENDQHDSLSDSGKITRSQARQVAMEKIQETYPDYEVSVATRNEGSGIKVSKSNASKKQVIKFYHSKVHPPKSGFIKQYDECEHGWHIVRMGEVTNQTYNLYIFSMIDMDGKWHFFLYTPDEISAYYDKYGINKGSELWLFFHVQGERAFELRGGKIDVTSHYNNWGIIASENEGKGETMKELENRFNIEMKDIYVAAKKLGYNAGYFLQMLNEKGGYQTAKYLIHTENPSDGFTKLWELKRLDLSVEAHVIKPEYSTLFTDEERQICIDRLKEYGYAIQ